jgi:hypothetical protein
MFYIQWPVGQFGFMESENKYQISYKLLQVYCSIITEERAEAKNVNADFTYNNLPEQLYY